MLAGGHILLEDIPGVGKTTLAMSIAKSMSLRYKRVQFTPDVLPSDIVGFSMYNQDTKTFEYQEGAVCCNLFLENAGVVRQCSFSIFVDFHGSVNCNAL